MKSRLPLLLLLTATLAGCGQEPAEPDDQRSAAGEVLEGTISDEMLPLGQLRSQPPLERTAPEGDAAATSEAGDAVEATEPESDGPESEADEAPEPSPEAEG